MSEIQTPAPPEQLATPGASSGQPNSNGRPPQQKRGPPLHQIYALPAPIRTFPLPTFYPNNPVSLLHIAYAWLNQAIRPPRAEPSVIHHGTWSPATTSVYIRDEQTMRALWEQGFYGKGNLSRSEPNWLKREQVRRGLQEVHVSEILTVQRREERAQVKWERARLEQEAIRQTRLEEASQAELRQLAKSAAKSAAKVTPPSPLLAPVGPTQLLTLPNSAAELSARLAALGMLNHDSLPLNETPSPPELTHDGTPSNVSSAQAPASPSDLTVRGEDLQISMETSNGTLLSGPSDTHDLNGIAKTLSPVLSSDSPELKALKRQKSVRFSPKVESTTFQLSDPPSPNHSPPGVNDGRPAMTNEATVSDADVSTSPGPDQETATELVIVNKEHLQLMPEETFFLSFGLGALAVTDPGSGRTLSSMDLFTLFRQYSYFPPRNGPDDPDLQPDDNFLLHYAVYHHFRSLGWVPRAGIKFGVDWLLYTRGPVFDHAEFGIMVIPSYSDPWWESSGKKSPERTWQWMHSIVRVLSHVMKSLVLVYVDVPPPSKLDAALEGGITEALKLYKVREVMVKRWSSNRNR